MTERQFLVALADLLRTARAAGLGLVANAEFALLEAEDPPALIVSLSAGRGSFRLRIESQSHADSADQRALPLAGDRA